MLFGLLHTFPERLAADDDDIARHATQSVCDGTDEEGRTLTAPLLIVGMPRSGATLVQQILAAHPAIIPGDDYTELAAAVDAAVAKRIEKGEVFDSKKNQLRPLSKEEVKLGFRNFPALTPTLTLLPTLTLTLTSELELYP